MNLRLITSAFVVAILTFGLAASGNCNAQQLSDSNPPNGRAGLSINPSDQNSATIHPSKSANTSSTHMVFSDQISAPPAATQSIPETVNSPEVFQPAAQSTSSQFQPNEIPIVRKSEIPNHASIWTAQENRLRRIQAGCPYSLSKRAACTYNPKYKGYYIGGGVPAGRRLAKPRGEPGYDYEGTWGVDYAPFYSRVASNWSHGRLFQGGTGQYEPDHKNHPYGQTFGKFFGNKDRRFESEHSAIEE